MFRPGFISLFGLFLFVAADQHAAPAALGIFESQGDIGTVLHPGAAEYDAASKMYTISGSGDNMWFAKDEFHFVWREISARDLSLTADISILGTAGNAHRKGLLMIRQGLDTDDAYVDAARHGEGLTSLQFRAGKGDTTHEIESNVSGPARLRIEKVGDRFYMWIAQSNSELEFSGGSARVEMHAPFYVGIGVCAHDKDAVEKVTFSNVDLQTGVTPPKADYSTIETVLLSGDARSGYVSTKHLTTPGWSADGQSLSYELDGKREETPFTPLRTAAPVGAPLTGQSASDFQYFETKKGHSTQVWRKKADGSAAEQLTSSDLNSDSPHVSPDGKYLLFLSYSKAWKKHAEEQEVMLRLMTLVDKTTKTLATFEGGPESLGPQPWSPDGRRMVFASYQTMK